MADCDHEPSLVVVDTAPSRLKSILLIRASGVEKLCPRNLISVVQVVDGVKYGLAVRQINDRFVRKHLFHAGDESFPFDGAVEIVAHEEATAVEEITQFGRLQIC